MNTSEKYHRLRLLLEKLSNSEKRDFRHFVSFWSKEKQPLYALLFEAIAAYLQKKQATQTAENSQMATKDFLHFILFLSRKMVSEKWQTDILKVNKKNALDSKTEEPNDAARELFTKNADYLFNKILENHRERSREGKHKRQVQASITDVGTLIEFGFFSDALRLVEQLKETSRQLAHPTLLLDLLRMERRIYIMSAKKTDSQSLEVSLQLIGEEEKIALFEIKATTELMAISNHFHTCSLEKKLPDPIFLNQYNAFETLFNSTNFTLITHDLPLQWLNAQFHKTALQTFGDYRKIMAIQSEIMLRYNSSVCLREDEPLRFRNNLANLVSLRLRHPDVNAQPPLNTLIESLKEAFNHNKAEVLGHVTSMELLHKIQQKRFADALEIIEKNRMVDELQRHQRQFSLSRAASIWYAMAVVFFVQSKADMANLCLNRLLFDLPKFVNMEAKTLANSLRLMLLIEGGSFVSHTDPTHVFRQINGLEKQGLSKPEPFDRTFWAFLQAIAVAQSDRKPRAFLIKIYEKAAAELAPTVEMQSSRGFFVYWLEAKSNEIALADFFKKQVHGS